MKNKTFGLVLMAGYLGLSQLGFTMRSKCVDINLDDEPYPGTKLGTVCQNVDQILNNPTLLEALLRIFTADTDQTATLHFGSQGELLRLSAKEIYFGRWPRAGAIAIYLQEKKLTLMTHIRQCFQKDKSSLVENITALLRLNSQEVLVEISLHVHRALGRNLQGNLVIETLPELEYVCKAI